MPDQLSLAGFDPAPSPTDSLFFAIFPDEPAAAQISQLGSGLIREHALSGTPIAAQRLHVTLHYLGGFPGLPMHIVTQAENAAGAVVMAPFEIVFDRVTSFRGGTRGLPIVLCGTEGTATLVAFQHALGEAMTRCGLGRWVKPQFTPHLTLLYDRRRVAEHAIEPIAWTVREFALVHSARGTNGRTLHVPLARWTMRG